MKFRLVIVVGLLLSVFMVRNARADYFSCSLTVSRDTVPIGQPFSYGVDIDFHQTLPGGHAPFVFTVVFYGTNINPPGETYPATFGAGHSDLTGYFNPGGFAGTYQRVALIYWNGNLICVTNQVSVTLQ